jgi:hypothetical protein
LLSGGLRLTFVVGIVMVLFALELHTVLKSTTTRPHTSSTA